MRPALILRVMGAGTWLQATRMAVRSNWIHTAACQLCLCCSLLTVAVAAPSALEPAQQDLMSDWSRFSRTVWFLQRSPLEQQADFAAIALNQLAEVYIGEADLARAEAALKSGSEAQKLQGWSRAVDQYAEEMLLLADEIDQGAALELLQGDARPVALRITQRVVILGHPRPDQQAAFEQRVLADFCSRADCKSLTAKAAALQPIPVSATGIKPRWTFTRDGQLCSHDGIEVHFADTRQLGPLRSTCEELVQEVEALANEIAWQQRHGVVIDWNSLLVSATPQRPEHLVRLNPAGDSILVTVPLVFGSQGLLEDLKPWLRYRVSGAERVHVRLDASRYGWTDAAQ